MWGHITDTIFWFDQSGITRAIHMENLSWLPETRSVFPWLSIWGSQDCQLTKFWLAFTNFQRWGSLSRHQNILSGNLNMWCLSAWSEFVYEGTKHHLGRWYHAAFRWEMSTLNWTTNTMENFRLKALQDKEQRQECSVCEGMENLGHTRQHSTFEESSRSGASQPHRGLCTPYFHLLK